MRSHLKGVYRRPFLGWRNGLCVHRVEPMGSGGGTVSITPSVAIVNDTTWSPIVGTWRPGRVELYVDG